MTDRKERWTEETQARALLLIGEGHNVATIALEVGVTEELVRGLTATGVTIYGKVISLGDDDRFPGEATITLLVSREEAMKVGQAGMVTQDVMGTFRIAKPSPRIVRPEAVVEAAVKESDVLFNIADREILRIDRSGALFIRGKKASKDIYALLARVISAADAEP